MKVVARYRGQLPTKFGVPKQSGLVPELVGCIVFEPDYRHPDYIRGIEEFDYLWLIWNFSENPHASTSPLVRPPVLGGNERVGVFASRSPFRPNPVGLSSVRLLGVEDGCLVVSGADLVDGTPIFDIKPYIEYADSHTGIRNGFVDTHPVQLLTVEIPDSIASQLQESEVEALRKILALDPRPHYKADSNRVYGMPFKNYDVKFQVNNNILTILSL